MRKAIYIAQLVLFIFLTGSGCGIYNRGGFDIMGNPSPEIVKKRQIYIDHNPDLSKEIRDCILKGSIRIGMTKEQVLLSWGQPSHRNTSVGSWGEHEQWNYRGVYGTYIYFRNDILTSWQN